MSPRKLSDSDREKVLHLYRTTEETTSTLATRFGVSSSTISRFLKTNLSETEYDELIQQKRLLRTPNRDLASIMNPELPLEPEAFEKYSVSPNEPEKEEHEARQPQETPPVVSSKPELTSKSLPITSSPSVDQFSLQNNQDEKSVLDEDEDEDEDEDDQINEFDVITLGEMLGEEIAADDEDEEDLDDAEEEEWEEETPRKIWTKNGELQVLPLSEASFPKNCYLVIDRAAELITRPLREFSDLGRIPVEEINQRTLPVFENHRVAKRFSTRREKVIKLPDSKLLEKTCSYLQAKGITRLLIDGQVYSLSIRES